jgi:hypothetical protein
MTQEFSGKAVYASDYEAFPFRLLVAVPCFVESLGERMHALVDTAGEWCVLPRRVAEQMDLDLSDDGDAVTLSTRFGTLHGQLHRLSVTFDAAEGESLTIDATCFVSEDWPGPMVIGWRGGLERMCFAFNTREEAFYFAAG